MEGHERPTGRIPRLAVQETQDPDRKPLAQWVVSGKTVRPADEVYAAGVEAPPAAGPRPLAIAAAVLAALFGCWVVVWVVLF
jgi:hypothetical protein